VLTEAYSYQPSQQHPVSLHVVHHSCNHIEACDRTCLLIHYERTSQGTLILKQEVKEHLHSIDQTESIPNHFALQPNYYHPFSRGGQKSGLLLQ